MNEDEAAAVSADESEFYGDDDVAAGLESKVENFDVQKWWQDYEAHMTALNNQARSKPRPTQQMPPQRVNRYNLFEGQEFAWQHTETVDEFVRRLSPPRTEKTPFRSWIWIWNPFVNSQHYQNRGGKEVHTKYANLATFMEAGRKRLDFVSSFTSESRKPGVSEARLEEETKKAGEDAANNILQVAEDLHVTGGKWMIDSAAGDVDYIWGIIAKATADGKLGIAAKVSLKAGEYRMCQHDIFVHTRDFSDKNDVIRVAKELKQLGLIKRSKSLVYKPDAYTYLSIDSNNKWQIQPTIYDTRSLLAR